MLIALFKVCMLLITFTVAVIILCGYTLHVFTTCTRYMYSLACYLSLTAADILLIPRLLLAYFPACPLGRGLSQVYSSNSTGSHQLTISATLLSDILTDL